MDNYVGKRLDGRYEVQEIIGVGGMAVVYKAYDSIDDRIVAVKILKNEFLANEEFRRRFKNESKAIAVLSHPNIVKVYDVSYGETLQYIIMEYIEGITLKEYIEQVKTVAWKEAIHFITQILRALQHAHDKGIVHRDIKPQNIMLIQNGNIKVTDFGIARFSRSETRTMSENAIGSVHYISPEQARGDITDDKADIYSVGVVLYEMLTGQVPFQSESSVSVAIMQLQAEPKRLREINDTIPLGLEQITMRAMQKSSSDRYQSAAEMLLDLEEFKRNPAVKFEYNYFVDKDPTKFVGEAPIRAKAAKYQTAVTEVNEQATEKNKIVPYIIGVTAGLFAIILLVVGSLALFTDTFKNDRLIVPAFVGMNYLDEIKGKEEYKQFLIVVEEVQNSQYDNGEVYLQNPTRGTKIKKTDKVVLTVATGSKMETIPNVYNLQFSQAKIALENLGFSVSEVAEPNTTTAFGTVLRTSPEQGKQAPQGSTVIIYYASDENLVEVPVLVGWKVDDARRLLESVGLVIDETIAQENSIREKDEIVKQNPEATLKVTKGSKISVVVSTGIPPQSNARISVKLPSRSSGVQGKIMASLNSDILFERQVLLDGSNYGFDVVGSGSNNMLKVFIDGELLYSCKIDFTKTPGVLSDEKTFTLPFYAKVPKVTGMQKDDAIDELEKIGFSNITITEKIVTNNSQIGRVLAQNPDSSILISRSLDTPITLQVGIEETETTP
jgi:eukaryotic-like serine/threonine-protein kinase